MDSLWKRGIRPARLAASLASDLVASQKTIRRTGADFMVDIFRSLGIEYLFANPASSFAAIHESVINYGGNRNPEFM